MTGVKLVTDSLVTFNLLMVFHHCDRVSNKIHTKHLRETSGSYSTVPEILRDTKAPRHAVSFIQLQLQLRPPLSSPSIHLVYVNFSKEMLSPQFQGAWD